LLSCLQSLLKQLSNIFLSRQVSHLLQTLKECQNGKLLLPTAYTAVKSVLRCQTHILTWLRCSVDWVCVRSNQTARCEKCDMGVCVPGASTVPHKGEI
jgi:hypothetical protein